MDKEKLARTHQFVDENYKPLVSKEKLDRINRFVDEHYISGPPGARPPHRRTSRGWPRIKRRIREHPLAAGFSAVVLVAIAFFAGFGIFQRSRPVITSKPVDTPSRSFNGDAWIARFIPPEQNPDGSFKGFRLDLNDNRGTAMGLGQGAAPRWSVNTDRAIRYYSRQLDDARDDPAVAAQSHTGMGIAYAMRAELDTAIDHFDRALALSPGSADALINRGLAYAGKGGKENLEKARGDLNEALKHSPEEKGILRALKEIVRD
jgi:tetratricopeptide (TPR) repeat protein